jgi:RimJ/RimL family protein N-acetyltransferase
MGKGSADKGPAEILIRRITVADVKAFRDLRLEALRRHPLAFTADLPAIEAWTEVEWRDLAERSDGDGPRVIIVAQAADGVLVGMAGVFTPPQPKLAHIGTVWGVYVREAFRGRGVGEALVRACIDWAQGKGLVGLKLSVVEGNDAAVRCYERCGFVRYGVEPMAVRWDGRMYDEALMARRL